MNRTSTLVLRLASVAAIATAVAPQAGAHHTAVHDQNPSPPPPLLTTTITHFASGSIIIPMDACYARMSFIGNTDLDQIVSPSNSTLSKCNGAAEKDGGLIPAYTLIMRLVNKGIPVNWAIKGGKTSWNDTDFSIVLPTKGPVKWRQPGSSTLSAKYSTITTVQYRGAPFVIDAAYAADALDLMDDVAATCNTGTCYDAVDLHIAQTDFDAPIYRELKTNAKLAVIDIDSDATSNFQNPQTGFLKGSIQEALMEDLEGVTFAYLTVQDVIDGKLEAGGYAIAWVPAFNIAGAGTANARVLSFFTALANFADTGGNLLFQDGGIQALEGSGTMNPAGTVYTAAKPVNHAFQINNGMVVNGTSSTYDNGNDSEQVAGQDYSDPPSQFGGSYWTGVGGSQYNWKPRYDKAYLDGVRRMLYSAHTTDDTKRRYEFASWRYKDNDSAKGRIFYLGGFNWRRATSSGFRILMNTLLVSAQDAATYTSFEVSRSAPILVDSTRYQGSFEVQQNDDDDDDILQIDDAPSFTGLSSADDFVFPFFKGHLRAITGLAEDNTEVAFDAATSAFDTGDLEQELIPDVEPDGCGSHFTTACRTVFTNTETPNSAGLTVTPDRVYMDTTNLTALKEWMGSSLTDDELKILIARILAGVPDEDDEYHAYLGGIDRSTMAIIEPSPLIPSETGTPRPTIIYVGALDGMLHAICANDVAPCTKAGMELWAYIPRTQLAALKFNYQRMDGSPKVADVFDDFDGDGRSEWRTVLTMQSGSGTSTFDDLEPTVFAMDITDPADPEILWERTTPASPGDVDLGVGMNLAMGPVRVSGKTRNITFVQTNNGGTGSPGFYLAAIDTADGSLVWDAPFTHEYPNPQDVINPTVPSSGIPGGVAGFDLDSSSMITDLAVPSLYGDLWIVNADDGKSKYQQTAPTVADEPAFRFKGDFHSIGAVPTIWADQTDQRIHVAVVSGGYADPTAATWSLLTETQYAVAMVADPSAAATPMNQTDATAERDFVVPLGNNRAFAQAVVQGDEIFIVTDETDVNLATYGVVTGKGHVYRVGLSTGAQKGATIDTAGGASSVDVDEAGVVHAGSGGKVQAFDVADVGGGGAFSAEGVAIEKNVEDATQRLLWISG